MLSTNRQDYIKDLEEVVFMFSTGSDLDISHEQKTADDEYFDKFALNGKVYEFKAQKHAETALELKDTKSGFQSSRYTKFCPNITAKIFLGARLRGYAPSKWREVSSAVSKANLKRCFRCATIKSRLPAT